MMVNFNNILNIGMLWSEVASINLSPLLLASTDRLTIGLAAKCARRCEAFHD